MVSRSLFEVVIVKATCLHRDAIDDEVITKATCLRRDAIGGITNVICLRRDTIATLKIVLR